MPAGRYGVILLVPEKPLYQAVFCLDVQDGCSITLSVSILKCCSGCMGWRDSVWALSGPSLMFSCVFSPQRSGLPAFHSLTMSLMQWWGTDSCCGHDVNGNLPDGSSMVCYAVITCGIRTGNMVLQGSPSFYLSRRQRQIMFHRYITVSFSF